MADRRFVNIRIEGAPQEINIEMPGNEKLGELIPDLVTVLQPPQYLGKFEGVEYQLFHDKELLSDGKSLVELGINNSETLILSLVESQSSESGDNLSFEAEGIGEKTIPFSTSTNVETLPQRQQFTRHHIQIDEPSLVSISPLGWVFVIGPSPFTIGRPDEGFIPDMDLTEIDTRVRSSRRHAEIIMKKERFAFVAQKTTNGTLINGNRLLPGKLVLLRNHDKIQFGRQGVKFVFQTPPKKASQ